MHKFGYVAIAGLPNVGKSTFLNSILGEKVAIVTPKPQTTRKEISGIYSCEDAQIVFLDTPGFHHSNKLLNRMMIQSIEQVISQSDLGSLLLDAKVFPSDLDFELWRKLGPLNPICIVNKSDLITKAEMDGIALKLKELFELKELFFISAKTGEGVKELVEEFKRRLPEGEAMYPKDIYSHHSIRFLVSELIREQLFLQMHQEIPYSSAVVIDDFREPRVGQDMTVIKATIFIEKESQKAMVIGKRGSRIKELGVKARQEIERLVGTKVFLQLFVKVSPDWTKDAISAKELV